MSNLIKKTPDADNWVRESLAQNKPNAIFGKIQAGVVWADVKGRDGKTLVAINPNSIVDEINSKGFDLLKGHDPGFPIGKVLSAATFMASDGTRFVAAILGIYQGSKPCGFDDLGLGIILPLQPSLLPALTDVAWIEFSVDPKEVEETWVKDALHESPLRIEQKERSHNAADAVTQLVSIGLPYAVLVWNPFVKAIGGEAGKDVYAATKQWLKRLFTKLPNLNNPIVVIVSHCGECQVSFIVRGTDVKEHHIALEALSVTAQTAAALVHKMRMAGFPPVKLAYEYRKEDGNWFPSFAELQSGKLITNNAKLIAVEKLPLGLSVGLTITKDQLP